MAKQGYLLDFYGSDYLSDFAIRQFGLLRNVNV